MRELEN